MVCLMLRGDSVEWSMLGIGVSLRRGSSCRSPRGVNGARLRSNRVLCWWVRESVGSWLKLSPRRAGIVDCSRILVIVLVLVIAFPL